jgi:hypothetical protein
MMRNAQGDKEREKSATGTVRITHRRISIYES